MIDAEQKKMIEEYAQMVATNLILYGVDMRDKYDSAIKLSCALAEAYNRGMSDGVKRAFESQPKVGEWISCSESLPIICDVYNVTRKISEGKHIFYISDAAYFDGQNTWHSDNRVNHGREYLKDVIAWQPLPEPYKE